MHSHPTAQLLLVAAYLVIVKFAVDVFAGGFPDSVLARAAKQSISS